MRCRLCTCAPIKNLESVAIGIAEFELKIQEYEGAGGTPLLENEKKVDLHNILPEVLRALTLARD